MIGLGIECTAHTLGIGIVKNEKIIANEKDTYTTNHGGIVPIEAAKHHEKVFDDILNKALDKSKIKLDNLDFISLSIGPGLSPCLLVGLRKMKELAKRLKIPVVPVNHCIAHLEIGRITGAKNPVLLYASGANTQIIAYEAGKYRIFGETLDLGVGNFIDTFARYIGLGFPGGSKVEQLALQSKNYVELPYTVKGMDIALSGILTNLKQKIERMNKFNISPSTDSPTNSHPGFDINDQKLAKVKMLARPNEINKENNPSSLLSSSQKSRAKRDNIVEYSKEDLAFSMQETVFAMLVEVAERALAHVGKKELVLGGGVACNSRFQEMCKIMCKERGAKMYVPERPLLVDNGAMIAYLGEIMYKSGIKFKGKAIEKLDIMPRQRTDDVLVDWK